MSKIQQNFVIVCESVVIDRDSNNTSFFNAFTNINTLEVPAVHPGFSVVTNFSGGEGEHKHSLVVTHEDGTEIARQDNGKIIFKNGKDAQHIGKFPGFPLPKLGMYRISAFVDGVEQPLKGKIFVVSTDQTKTL